MNVCNHDTFYAQASFHSYDMKIDVRLCSFCPCDFQ